MGLFDEPTESGISLAGLGNAPRIDQLFRMTIHFSTALGAFHKPLS